MNGCIPGAVTVPLDPCQHLTETLDVQVDLFAGIGLVHAFVFYLNSENLERGPGRGMKRVRPKWFDRKKQPGSKII